MSCENNMSHINLELITSITITLIAKMPQQWHQHLWNLLILCKQIFIQTIEFSAEHSKPHDVFILHISSHSRIEQNQPGQTIQELTITRVFASGQATTHRMFHSTVRYLPFQKTPSTSTYPFTWSRKYCCLFFCH